MNKLVMLAAAGLMALGTSATAADMRPYTKAAPVAYAAYDWSGLYVGINGGGGWSGKCWDLVNDSGTIFSPPLSEGCHNASGGTFGGQIGYRWQTSAWVFGLEAQGNWADFRGSNINLSDSDTSDHSRITSFGLFTGQIGYAINNVLLYAKGGAAVVADRYEARDVPTGLVVDRASESRWGGAVGVGLEVGFAPNWTLGFEYDHLFMGTRNVNSYGVGNFGIAPGVFSATDRIRQDVDLATVRLNYRFGGPAVPRY
jgi:outer membrane immunogenic protein